MKKKRTMARILTRAFLKSKKWFKEFVWNAKNFSFNRSLKMKKILRIQEWMVRLIKPTNNKHTWKKIETKTDSRLHWKMQKCSTRKRMNFTSYEKQSYRIINHCSMFPKRNSLVDMNSFNRKIHLILLTQTGFLKLMICNQFGFVNLHSLPHLLFKKEFNALAL